jgi:hypothetical protein
VMFWWYLTKLQIYGGFGPYFLLLFKVPRTTVITELYNYSLLIQSFCGV